MQSLLFLILVLCAFANAAYSINLFNIVELHGVWAISAKLPSGFWSIALVALMSASFLCAKKVVDSTVGKYTGLWTSLISLICIVGVLEAFSPVESTSFEMVVAVIDLASVVVMAILGYKISRNSTGIIKTVGTILTYVPAIFTVIIFVIMACLPDEFGGTTTTTYSDKYIYIEKSSFNETTVIWSFALVIIEALCNIIPGIACFSLYFSRNKLETVSSGPQPEEPNTIEPLNNEPRTIKQDMGATFSERKPKLRKITIAICCLLLISGGLWLGLKLLDNKAEAAMIYLPVKENGRWYFVDISGNRISKDTWDLEPSVASDGIFTYKSGDDISVYKLVDGRTVAIDGLQDLAAAGVYSEGVMPICHKKGGISVVDGDGKERFELTSINGHEVISCNPKFTDGCLIVCVDNYKQCVVDTEGNVIVPPEFDEISYFNGSSALAAIYDNYNMDGGAQYFILDTDGNKTRVEGSYLTPDGEYAEDWVLPTLKNGKAIVYGKRSENYDLIPYVEIHSDGSSVTCGVWVHRSFLDNGSYLEFNQNDQTKWIDKKGTEVVNIKNEGKTKIRGNFVISDGKIYNQNGSVLGTAIGDWRFANPRKLINLYDDANVFMLGDVDILIAAKLNSNDEPVKYVVYTQQGKQFSGAYEAIGTNAFINNYEQDEMDDMICTPKIYSHKSGVCPYNKSEYSNDDSQTKEIAGEVILESDRHLLFLTDGSVKMDGIFIESPWERKGDAICFIIEGTLSISLINGYEVEGDYNPETNTFSEEYFNPEEEVFDSRELKWEEVKKSRLKFFKWYKDN